MLHIWHSTEYNVIKHRNFIKTLIGLWNPQTVWFAGKLGSEFSMSGIAMGMHACCDREWEAFVRREDGNVEMKKWNLGGRDESGSKWRWVGVRAIQWKSCRDSQIARNRHCWELRSAVCSEKRNFDVLSRNLQFACYYHAPSTSSFRSPFFSTIPFEYDQNLEKTVNLLKWCNFGFLLWK